MIAFVWLLLATTWAGHVAALCLPAAACYNFILGNATPWTQAVIWASLVPQLIVIPWAWRDCTHRVANTQHRRLWRLTFFLTGFVAVTVYALRYKCGAMLHRGATEPYA